MAEIKKPDAVTRRARLVQIGTTLHGPLFGKVLAAGMGVSQQLISHIVSGRRNVTDDVERRLLHYAVAVLDARQEAMRRTVRHIGELSYELGDLGVYTKSSTLPVGQSIEPAPEPDHEPDAGMTPSR